MAKENVNGLMEMCMKVNGRRIKKMAKENIYGLMEMCMKGNGRRVFWKVVK